MGAGPLTGFLERPSQGAPENRKAGHRDIREAKRAERDPVQSARAALRGGHAAERQLLAARHAAERRAVLEAGRAAAGFARDMARRLLAAKYADRLARVFDSGDARAAWAARERLKLEEAIETAHLDLAHARSESDALRSSLSGLRLGQRAERQGMAQRQRRQRAMLGVIVSRRRRAFRAEVRPALAAPTRRLFRSSRQTPEKHR